MGLWSKVEGLRRSEGKYHNSGIEDITLLSIPHLEIYLTQKRGERKLRVNEGIPYTIG